MKTIFNSIISLKHFMNIATMFIICFLFLCNSLVCATELPYTEKDENVIRYGFFPLPGFNEYDDLGNPTGYNIEYLKKLSDHNGWKYDFIKARSWPEALQMLEDGEIDLLAPSQKTPEREMKFGFAEQPFGLEYGSILTLEANDSLTLEDFEKFSTITFGCVKSLVFKDAFFKYAETNGFKTNVKYYNDTIELMEALEKGQVDAIVANLMNAKNNMKVLAKFSPSQFYYITNKENTELLNELNKTINHMKVTHLETEKNLNDKYFPFYNQIAFTKSELDYILKAPVFNVGCVSNRAPISYVDSKTEKIAGLTKDILDHISEISGLKFNMIPLPTSPITYDYLRDNHIQLVSNTEYNDVNSAASGIKLTNPYLVTRKVVVGKDPDILETKGFRIALSTGSQTLEKVIKKKYPDSKIIIYETIKESFDAVYSGHADVLIQNQYAVERFLPKPKYEKLTVIPSEGTEDALAIAALIYQKRRGIEDSLLADPRLINIINKSIADISEDDISGMIINQTTNNPYKFSTSDFFYRYKHFILTLTFLLLALIAIGTYAFIQKSKRSEIIKKSENNLKNITNNINGGVVVLLPNQGLRIIFANEGFLSLIQYTAVDYEELKKNNYITYVHPDDIDKLNSTLADKEHGDKQISIRLRLLRKDGEYVPTLFNGTLIETSLNKKELYCVIMDISEQVKIMQELDREKSKYKLLLDRSNDIIFDINLETKEIFISNLFEEQFGFKLPSHYECSDLDCAVSMWRIHAEDADIFKTAIKEMINNETGTECNVRLNKRNLSYCWCNIALSIVKNNGIPSFVIGKIADINDEVAEKKRLLNIVKRDNLTGLYNKETFKSLSVEYLKENGDKPSAIIFIDIDNFKQINDALGHLAGDQALITVAEKLQLIYSQFDIISRFGGDEFCIFVKNIPIETLKDKLNWTLEKLSESYDVKNSFINVTASLGVVLIPDQGVHFDRLLECADQALYDAKERGKNQYSIFGE